MTVLRQSLSAGFAGAVSPFKRLTAFVKKKTDIMRELPNILDRIMALESIKTDVKLAELFDVAPTTVTTWRKRNSVPYGKIMAYCELRGLSLEYVFYGEGPKYRKGQHGKQEPLIHPHELGKKVSEVGSAIKDIGKEIEKLRIAPSHECVDYAELKSLIDGDKPPKGLKERRKFIKNVKKIVRSHPAHQEG